MTTSAQSDAELLALAHQGEETAFAELYVRHEAAALRLARGYPRAGDPDDLVNEAFTRVLRALRQGSGPTEAFRAYLFVALRRIAAARIARRQDDPYDEVPEPVRSAAAAAAAPPAASGSTASGGGAGSLFGSDADAEDRRIVVDAYESLPDRWQSVLWATAVEGHPPRELGPVLGMSANAASALAYRAREKLRQAYLQAHLQVAARPGCDPHRSRLGAYVRDGLGPRDRATTDEHLGVCASCRSLVDELSDINRLLVRSLVPFFISTASISGAVAAKAAGAAAATAAARLSARQSRYGTRRTSRLADKPGVAAGAVVAAAALVTVMVAVLADHAMPPAPLNLPPVPSSGPETSDEVASPVRPDRDGTGTSADEPVVIDEPEPRRPTPPPPRSPSASVTGSGSPSSSSSSPPASRSRGSLGGSRGSAAPTVPTRPVVTTPPPVTEPAPHPPTHPVTTTPSTTQPPVTTPPTSPPTTRPPTSSTVPPTTAPPVTVPPLYQPPGGGGLRSCICDILGSILRCLL